MFHRPTATNPDTEETVNPLGDIGLIELPENIHFESESVNFPVAPACLPEVLINIMCENIIYNRRSMARRLRRSY